MTNISNSDDFVGKIMAYEGDEMTDDETIQFFQELLDSGDCWRMQGHYGRMATHLLTLGLIHSN